MAAKNKAAVALAKRRWEGTTAEERSAAASVAAKARAKKIGKRAMRLLAAKGGAAGKGTAKPGSGRKPGPPKAASPKRPRGRPRKTVQPLTENEPK